MPKTELEIAGMTCADCALHVREALERAGAREVRIDWRAGRGTVGAGAPGQLELNEALAGTRYRVRRVSEPLAGDRADPARGTRDCELVVLGSGSGAFAAAIRARDLGRRVVLVERATIGGTCVNVGCIPSKSLLVSAGRSRGRAGELARAVAVKAKLVEQLRQRKYVDLLGEYGIDYREGDATLRDAHAVEVSGEQLTADAIVIATGARPAVPAIDGLKEAGYLTSTSALELTEPPRRLAVIGANAVGLELGQMLGDFGSHVTFISRRALAPRSEPEVSRVIRDVLEAKGHAIMEHVHTERVSAEGDEKLLRGRDAQGEPFEVRAEEVLLATGREPNTEGLGLRSVGVQTDARGAIVVDERQRTSVPSIYAVGDVTNQPQFVYVAAAGGAAAAQNALADGERRLDFSNLPRIIFTTPQIATAGITEREAAERGFEVQTSVLALEAIPRALVNQDTRGLFKLVAEAGSGRLLGASIIADCAGEVIQAAVLAIQQGMTVEELASAWAPYLTMAEGLKLAAQAFGRDVAKLSCCAA
jgi:mercuric reductase